MIDTPTEGTETTVTFEVSSPELATRYGEGNNATVLEWYVYEVNGSEYKNVAGLNGTKTFQKQTTVGIKFLMGRTYHVLFWAHAEDAPYEVDPNAATMTVDYANLTANNEDYDAFYKFHEVGLVTTAKQGGTVELTRPFAQLNVATSDTADAANAGYTLDKTGITVKVYGKMDFKTGEVDKTTLAERTFAPATKATGTVTVGGTTYDVISMNYLLVNTKETPDVKLSLQEANSSETLERVYTSVPVQRNHRTYILGNVFTKPTEFTIVIEEGFLDDHLEEWDGTTYEEIEAGADGYFSVSHAAELAWILTENKDNIKIRLEADINFGGEELPAETGRFSNLTIEGNGNQIFNFTRTNDNGPTGLFSDVATATISNLIIDAAKVDAGKGGEAYAGALFGRTYGTIKLTNVTVKNSKVAGTTKVGGLIGFVAENDVIIENCHVIDTDVTTYSVAKESGSAGGFIGCIMNSATISNSSVEGGTLDFIMEDPEETPNVLAKRANSKFIGVVANGTVVLTNCTVDVENYTNDTTDCAGYVSPYGDFVGGNRGTATVVIDGEAIVAANNVAQFIAAFNNIEDGDVISLSSNVNFTEENRTISSDNWYEGIYYVGDKSFTIDLNGQTISDNGGVINDYMLLFKNNGEKANTITIKNGKIDAGSKAYCALCTSSTSTQAITINLENVELINKNSNGSTIKVRSGTILNVKAGTKITGADSYLGIECSTSTVNIYDGVEIKMQGTTSYNGSLVGVGGNGVVNVYGGKGTGVKGGFIAMTSGGTINAMGGEWIANTDGTFASDNKAVLIAQNDKNTYPSAGNSVVNVSGGTYKGGYCGYAYTTSEAAQINISGGNFNADPSTYVKEGYKATQNADDSWTVAAE